MSDIGAPGAHQGHCMSSVQLLGLLLVLHHDDCHIGQARQGLLVVLIEGRQFIALQAQHADDVLTVDQRHANSDCVEALNPR